MNLYVIGDLHFSAMQDWSIELGDKFLDWFSTVKVEPNSELIQLGDCVETAINPGRVIDLLYRFAKICSDKFSQTYILQGNHDIKKYKNKEQSAIEFLKSKKRVSIITKETIFTTPNGFSIMAFPHVFTHGLKISDYINSHLAPQFYNTKVDLLVGHINSRVPGDTFLDDGIELSKFNFNKVALGHIHTRIANYYTGSIWPNKISEEETAEPRKIFCFSKNQTIKEEAGILIPKFLNYAETTYPNLPTTTISNLINIYTVNNCPNLTIAKTHYNGLYIRAVHKQQQSSDVQVKTGSLFTFEKPIDALNSYMKETKTALSRPVYSYVSKLLAS